MSDSEHLNNSGSADSQESGITFAELDENAHLSLEDKEEKESEPRGKKLVYALTALSALVLLFALVAIFFAFQGVEENDAAEAAAAAEAEASAEATVVATEEFLTGAIVVAHETDYITYNANLDGSMQVAGGVEEPEAELIFPGEDALGANYSNIIGIDVLDAQARAQAVGYVVHQVFVVCPNVVNNNAAPPRPGQVLEVQTYNMRGDGQRYMFLHVMTTDPVGNARAVPNVVGSRQQAGHNTLVGVGLGSRVVHERNSSDASGTVLFQAPQAGRFTPAGSTVIMVLAD